MGLAMCDPHVVPLKKNWLLEGKEGKEVGDQVGLICSRGSEFRITLSS